MHMPYVVDDELTSLIVPSALRDQFAFVASSEVFPMIWYQSEVTVYGAFQANVLRG